jgi:uncharacterized membrane protein HdeD (DUF308 family)
MTSQILKSLKKSIKQWYVPLITGIIFIILVFDPTLAGITMIILTGITLIVAGIFSIFQSLILKKLNEFQKTEDIFDAEYEVIE